MYYGNIKYYDVANGLGIRTSLFVSGCRNHCKGCFQPETWNFKYGKEFNNSIKNQILKSLMDPKVSGLSILGGEPFEPENVIELLYLVRDLKDIFDNEKDIWVWTGYIFEDLYKRDEVTREFLSYIDILIDGPFMIDKKDLSLDFRGSSNQRILILNKLSMSGKILDKVNILDMNR